MNVRRLATGLLSGLCLVAGASCHKTAAEPDPEAVQVSYAHTQCADPWGYTTSNQQLVDAAYTYLKNKGITSFPLQTSQTGQSVVCTACACPTGVVLTGTARTVDLPALQAMGFVKL